VKRITFSDFVNPTRRGSPAFLELMCEVSVFVGQIPMEVI